MVDESKVRLMTRIAIYEQNEGKKDFKMNRYTEKAYVNLKVLESSVVITIAYILCVVFVSFKYFAEISTKGFSFPYRSYIMYVAGIYAVVFLIHFIFARRHYRSRYEKMRHNIRVYDRELYILKKKIQKG